ncbi:MAG: PIN domain-containing protein [Opitutales bacterium]|nr:PIN domain-containing protein [Opitutales bacterium]
MIYLLDANVLIALLDTGHAHHTRALRFFPSAQREGWATCPLVENAFVRIFGRPRYPNGPGSPQLARQLLVQYCATQGHHFFPDDLTLRDSSCFRHLPGVTALTDLYLLALAIKNGGRFATLDENIDASLIPGGPAALHVLAPA